MGYNLQMHAARKKSPYFIGETEYFDNQRTQDPCLWFF